MQRGPFSFTAKLNYRKFSCYYTQFSYAGEPKPGQNPCLLASDHNSLEYQFRSERTFQAMFRARSRDRSRTCRSSRSPHAEASIPVSEQAADWQPVTTARRTRERWNDWGIGLLLQGDLKGAEYAFRKATEAEPGYADGWLNVARALIQEGETDARKAVHRKGACKSILHSARIYFFQAP